MPVPAVRVLVTTAGNEFMLDIAATLVDGMRVAGARCELAIDLPPLLDDAALQVVVAPHEYVPLFLEPLIGSAELDGAIASTYVLNVEQPDSSWFELAWLYARASRGVFDIDPEGAAEFARRGLAAVHTPLGMPSHPTIAPATERPIDVLFLGHASPRRERFFADHAEAFSHCNCRLLFADVGRPRREDTPGYAAGETRARLLAQSKVLLNVHSSERPYFERHRALLAFAHGCALVTETSSGIAPLVNGAHMEMAPLHELATTCLRLLDDPERLTGVATAGQRIASERLSMADSCRTMLAHAASLGARRSTLPDDERLRREVRHRLTDSLAARAAGQTEWQVHDNVHWLASEPARVSAVVTVFDYARYLDECVASVVASDPVPGGVELVIVDDGSQDGSLDRARALAEAAPIPARVVAKHRNTGLADARNVGLRLARGALALTLDADNWIYPSCLARLAEALEDGEVAAAYPILRRFHDGSGAPAGLVSRYAWSPRDLVRGPYIDALALFRRDALIGLGSYATDLIDHGWFGWEDYELWLRLAESGAVCRHVPAVLACYRVHRQSMLGRTNRSTDAIARHLASRFNALAAQYPGQESYFGFPVTGAAARLPAVTAAADPAGLAARCQDLEGEVRAFRTSWSWRVTSPLRFVYRQLGLAARRGH